MSVAHFVEYLRTAYGGLFSAQRVRPGEDRKRVLIDGAIRIRRFLPEMKLRDLVQNRVLHFAPASSFEDKMEGRRTDADLKDTDLRLVQWGLDSDWRIRARDAEYASASHNRGATVILCWTMESTSCARMWTDYGQSKEAVAIETTIGKLRTSLGPNFLVVPVEYIDFSQRSIPNDHSLRPYLFKRDCFAWETDVRVIADMEPGARTGSPRRVPIRLEGLIDQIVISPSASDAFADEVRRLVEVAAPSVKVRRSR